MLSQLSYRPDSALLIPSQKPIAPNVVGLGRVELPTFPLSGERSSQLSYRPSQSEAQARTSIQLREHSF
jgi:hypothetical protein